MTIYDTYPVEGNCKGCGKATEWHINGDYPLCIDCMHNLIVDIMGFDDFIKYVKNS